MSTQHPDGPKACIGQKNKLTWRWARLVKGSGRRSRMEWQGEGKRGTRPSVPQDQRTASTYIFGAICPKEGKGAALVIPWCSTDAIAEHLAAIVDKVEPGRHAALLLDQAGWHMSTHLAVPEKVTLIPLPPKCPELNLQKTVWQFMRDNWLSNRVFTFYENLVDHCCAAWNKLVDQPWTTMSIGLRDMGA